MPSLSPTPITAPPKPAGPIEQPVKVEVSAPQNTQTIHAVAYRFKNVNTWNLHPCASREEADNLIKGTVNLQDYSYVAINLPL